ncbi:8-oxo-dGTP diphosphatase MutT [bacterium]|nr:8-oxo-dGTP diphosphatase MutT [bacterium]
MAERKHILVAAGLIWRDDGMILISQRPQGGSHAGCWELPGGKVESGETVAQALEREIREELGVEVAAGPEFNRVTHEYAELTVTLAGLHARYVNGEPQALEVADWRWVRADELMHYEFPAANTRLFDCEWKDSPYQQ